MIHIKEELCVYCGACVAVCPENIIELIDTHLKIDQPKCIDCMKCLISTQKHSLKYPAIK